jgi:hypothetical protein
MFEPFAYLQELHLPRARTPMEVIAKNTSYLTAPDDRIGEVCKDIADGLLTETCEALGRKTKALERVKMEIQVQMYVFNSLGSIRRKMSTEPVIDSANSRVWVERVRVEVDVYSVCL